MAKSGGGLPFGAAATGLVLMRVFLGAFFLYCGIDQLIHSAKFVHFFRVLEVGHPVSAYPGVWDYFAGFVHGPTAASFPWTIIGVELLVGMLLVLGFLTRAAAAIPIAADLYFFYSAFPVLQRETLFHGLWINVGFLLMALAVLLGAAGRSVGLDALLARRTRVKIFW